MASMLYLYEFLSRRAMQNFQMLLAVVHQPFFLKLPFLRDFFFILKIPVEACCAMPLAFQSLVKSFKKSFYFILYIFLGRQGGEKRNEKGISVASARSSLILRPGSFQCAGPVTARYRDAHPSQSGSLSSSIPPFARCASCNVYIQLFSLSSSAPLSTPKTMSIPLPSGTKIPLPFFFLFIFCFLRETKRSIYIYLY